MEQRSEILRRQIAESEEPTEQRAKPIAQTGQKPRQPLRVDPQPKSEKSSTSGQTPELIPIAGLEKSTNQVFTPDSIQVDTAETPAETEAHPIRMSMPEAEKPIVVKARAEITEIGTTSVTASELPELDETGIAEDIPSAPKILPMETKPVTVDVSEIGEIVFDEEVMDTFEQLAALIEQEREKVPSAATELYEMSEENEINLLSQELAEAIQANKVNVFEEFVAAQDPPETSPDIEDIIAEADSRPLEETLAQLSFYLSEAAEMADDASPEAAASVSAIREALNDLAEILPPAGIKPGQAEKLAITPEMTQKLLILLRAVGYDNPREILIGFVERNDFEFLIQAIRYLYQLSDSANQKELLSITPVNFTVMDADEPLTARLGRAIMQRLFSHDPAILPA